MGPVDHIALQARLRPNHRAVHDLTTDRRWTYAELEQAVARCAGLLGGAYGCTPGDRVAILARNSAEHVIAHHACARAGLVFVPMNWRLSPAENADLLAYAEPILLIGDAELERAGLTGVALADFAAAIDATPPLAPAPIDPEQISLMLFTSGTSGRPKGVMLSERALAQTALSFGLLGAVTGDSAFLIDGPMFHVIGLVTSVRPAMMQGAAILISNGFEPPRTLARMADPALGVTHYFCVPQMADRLRAEPGFDPAALAGMTGVFTGGAPHPADSIHAWIAAGVPIVDGFGMSEAGTVFGMPLDPAIIAAKAGSAGVPTPGIQTRLVDGEGRDVAAGAAGEILLKGDNLFSDYWRRPADYAAAFTDDGWFRTGDIAVCDADGFFSIIDRKKDMFISGGENVYPAEIEALLVGLPGLREVAIVGVPHARWGEVGLCVLASDGEAEGLIERVREHLASCLASYKQPRLFRLVDALPRTGSGKVVKGELKASHVADPGATQAY